MTILFVILQILGIFLTIISMPKLIHSFVKGPTVDGRLIMLFAIGVCLIIAKYML